MKIVVLFISLFLFTCHVNAQEKKYQLSKKTYDGIMKTQKLLDANNTKEAEKTLKDLEASKSIKAKLDQAYVRFYLGYYYVLQDNTNEALKYFKQALALEALPPEQISNTYLNVIQLSMELEQYNEALIYLDKLIAITTPPKAQYFIYKANIYLSQKKYAKVTTMIDKAINIEKKPKKNWLKMQFYAFYMQKQYKSAITVMKKLIVYEPNNKEYWLQLSSLYSLSNNYTHALATLDISRIAKLHLKQSEWLRLIGWLRYSSVPYKAADIMHSQIEAGPIEKSEKNLNLLGDLYYEAKAYDEAIASYTQAATIHKNAKIYYKIAQISMQQYAYERVIKYITLALKGSEEKLGEKNMLLGKSYYELKKISKAQKAFKEALKYKPTHKMAQAWLHYIRS